jgi:hypothetical protein
MSDAREQAIEAGARAVSGLSPFDLPAVLAAVIDAAEPIIRADERERMTLPEWTQVVHDARNSAQRDVLADLRAKVEVLREESVASRRQASGGHMDAIIPTWHNGRTDGFDAVLALFEQEVGDE